MSWVSNLVSSITSTFTDLGSAVLGFIKEGFITLFFDTTTVEGVTTKSLSDFAIFTFVMLGISLCLGLTKWITSLVRRKI